MNATHKVLVLDFGSQYTQLIARRIREFNVYSEIWPYTRSIADIRNFQPSAVILSGGPASVHVESSPNVAPEFWQLGVPVLGICYGMQLMCHTLGGRVRRANTHEYGRSDFTLRRASPLFRAVKEDESFAVWMSHGDAVERLPTGFVAVGTSKDCPFAAVADESRQFYGLQFHPEVVHTEKGKEIIKNFLFEVAAVKADWTMGEFLHQKMEWVQNTVGQDKVICGLSGGVDSSVVAQLLHRAIGSQLRAVFVNNGLLRQAEAEEVQKVFRQDLGLPLHYVDASKQFLDALRGVVDPEIKRKTIGRIFVEVFEQAARDVGPDAKWLAQGTLYPDVIESVSFQGGPSVTIKSHHNVGGLPERMHLKLLEPLRELFKDEVRLLGKQLQLPDTLVNRHPFPGPGLAIRVLGEVTEERLHVLRQADAILRAELDATGLVHATWQAFVVLLPVHSVGVMGDARTYENVCAIRAVTSVDGMTADWARLPHEALAKISNRISNEVRGINRVVYDISSKPPATIEWE